MATDIDRKKLWGRSGSRCAICNSPLTAADGLDSIVGDEAHIRSPSAGGPRHDTKYPADKLNSYPNLILLCKTHHKLIDDNTEVFPAELLDSIKTRHERRVDRALNHSGGGWVTEPNVVLIDNGTTLTSLISASQAFSLSNDHPESDGEAGIIGGFLQEIQDWGDILGDVGPSGQVDASMSLHRQLTELGALGFSTFGGIGTYRLLPDFVVPALFVRVVRQEPSHSGIAEEMGAEDGP